MSGGEKAMSRVAYWDSVYTTKQPERVSWFQPHLDLSLELLERAGLSRSTRIIDIGAGASTLVDDLLARDVQTLTALDISAAALQVTRDRLRRPVSSRLVAMQSSGLCKRWP